MTPDDQLELVRKHYTLNGAGDFAAAELLLTDDFSLSIPSYMPFGGEYRGKDAFRKAIPAVIAAVGVPKLKYVATTVGDDYVVKIVEFTLEGDEAAPTQVAELIRFRGRQICEIRPFYADHNAFITAAARRKSRGDGQVS